MTDDVLEAEDYPVAEKHPERVVGPRGRKFDELSLEAAVKGDVTMDDLRTTPSALLDQARIARSVGRSALAANFERAAEMARLPQDDIMRIYELLRPGRAASKAELMEVAAHLRSSFEAESLARFVEEAADVYERRNLYRTRY